MKGKQVSDKTTGVGALIKDSELDAYIEAHQKAGRKVVFISNNGEVTSYDKTALKASNG